MPKNADLHRPPQLFQERRAPMTDSDREEEEKAHLRKEIAQLQKELVIVREKISVTALDLVQFTIDNKDKDRLFTQKNEPKTSPWRDGPKSCCIMM